MAKTNNELMQLRCVFCKLRIWCLVFFCAIDLCDCSCRSHNGAEHIKKMMMNTGTLVCPSLSKYKAAEPRWRQKYGLLLKFAILITFLSIRLSYHCLIFELKLHIQADLDIRFQRKGPSTTHTCWFWPLYGIYLTGWLVIFCFELLEQWMWKQL